MQVSSESGWSPDPEFFAKRQYKKTEWGWFPVEDAFGGGECPGGRCLPQHNAKLNGQNCAQGGIESANRSTCPIWLVYLYSNHPSHFLSLMTTTAGKPAIGGEWSLIDLDGNLVTNRTFEGKWTLLYFGFARCPDICPSEMVKVGKVMDTLAEQHPELAKNLQPIFVSVDPARDSLKALKEYGKDFHPSYVFLTGSPEQVQKMAKKYRVYVSKADETEDGDYLVDHSIVIYFHDDQGDLADCFTQSMRPSDVVEKIVERMTFVPKY